jgi:hypothetical protein
MIRLTPHPSPLLVESRGRTFGAGLSILALLACMAVPSIAAEHKFDVVVLERRRVELPPLSVRREREPPSRWWSRWISSVA